MKKTDHKETKTEKNKIELASLYERLSLKPCKSCRKRDSCLIMPIKESCMGYEVGTPYYETWEATLPD